MMRFLRKINRKWATALAILLAVLLLALFANGFRQPLHENGIAESGVTYCILDVGQANAALVFTPGGVILIDAGSNDSEAELCAALRYYGAERIAYLFITHGDEDHIGGLDAVLSEFVVERLICTSETYAGIIGSRTEATLRNAERTHGTERITATGGDAFSLGDVTMRMLAPFAVYSSESEGENNRGLAIALDYGETVAIFPGDAEREGEIDILRNLSGEIRCDLLMVSHHGSDSSSIPTFVSQMAPKYAVISCGKDNIYGHPSGKVLERFLDIGSKIYRTDLCGDLLFYSDGVNVSAENEGTKKGE